MAQDDTPRPVPELVVRGALAAYVEGGIPLHELMSWLAETCGGPRAAGAPALVCDILGVLEYHFNSLRADLRDLLERSRGPG